MLALADTLEALDIGGNAIRTLPHGVARLRRLRVLFGSRNPFRELPEALGECSSLSQVGFRSCRIETVPASSLPPRLRWLTLTDNRIRALPSALGARPALRKLLLSGNRLDALPDSLAGSHSLELLRIAANRFGALPPFLTTMPRLAWLGFAGNPAEGAPAPASRTAVSARSLSIGEQLGEGASGVVHAAEWRRDGENEPVAFKLFKGATGSDGLASHEIDAAITVGRHPALLGGLAAVPDHPSGRPGLLLPFVDTDWRPLAAPPDADTCSRDVYDPTLRLDAGVPRRIARAVAAAGAHLSARRLLHGDLYAHNILWDGADGRARLGDLGAASRVPPGPLADRLRATDILAWGILAEELLGRALCPDDELRAIARRAIDPDPASRPSFDEILGHLGSGRDGVIP